MINETWKPIQLTRQPFTHKQVIMEKCETKHKPHNVGRLKNPLSMMMDFGQVKGGSGAERFVYSKY